MSGNENNAFEAHFQDMALDTDKADLFALLSIRFGNVPPNARAFILQLTDTAALERLILVASNVPDWQGFLVELKESANAFRIVGEQYRPV